ncbi:MAG: succinylglutamate desuccinylase/aspartoacylase family protein [Acidobacteriaceae bacterium]|jgi:predicted deacylase|nr:succinylglutamate desuccinylase/aspartoacylase family protein [Acidobacteriaceae bacterium]
MLCLPAAPGLHRFRSPFDIAAIAVRGAADGPTLLVSAGVHGDEYEGVRAIFETVEALDAGALRGTLLTVPVLNYPAHRAVTRHHPADGANLARQFPGRADGTASERLAHAFTAEFLPHADFYLDLHSGGIRFAMPSMVGYEAADPRGRAAAAAFGAPVIWGHPVIEPGRTISAARALGIPFLYTEARGAGRIHPDDLLMMRRGITNLLRHLGMLDGAPEIPAPPQRLHGIGNTDEGVYATASGFFMPSVALLDPVRAGQPIGRIVDELGEVLATPVAPADGIVGLLRELPPVDEGDVLLLVATPEEV